jgi:hypothetical protein
MSDSEQPSHAEDENVESKAEEESVVQGVQGLQQLSEQVNIVFDEEGNAYEEIVIEGGRE